VESRGDLAARRRSLAARDADDIARAFSLGIRGRLFEQSRVLRGLKAWPGGEWRLGEKERKNGAQLGAQTAQSSAHENRPPAHKAHSSLQWSIF
jgi:hypothetical protein